MSPFGRLLLLAILQDDRQLYGVERLFDSQQFENLELAESANCGHSGLLRSRNHGAGKDEFLRFSIPANFWQYSVCFPYTQ
jgi:hypothetical protein